MSHLFRDSTVRKSSRYSGVATLDPDEQSRGQDSRRTRLVDAAPVLPRVPETVPEAEADPEGEGWRGTAERVQDLLEDQAEPYGLKTVTAKVDGSARAICCSNHVQDSMRSRLTVPPTYKWLLLGVALWLGVGFIAGMSGLGVTDEGGRSLTVVECLYLMSQVLTTTGYGDLVPKTGSAKVFFLFYVLASGLFVSGLMCQFIGSATESSRATMDEIWGHIFNEKNSVADFQPNWCVRHKDLLLSLAILLVVIFAWTTFFVLYCDWFFEEDHEFEEPMQRCEDRDWQTAAYFAVVGMLGIGFGDIVPRTVGGQLFCAVVGLLGLGVYLNFLECMAGMVHVQNLRLNTETLIHASWENADINGDESLDYGEFLQYVLGHYQLVSVDVLKKISRLFDDLDVDRDGAVSFDELRNLMEAHRSRIKEMGSGPMSSRRTSRLGSTSGVPTGPGGPLTQ